MFPNYTELGGRILALAMGAYIQRIRFPRLGILTTRVSQANPQDGITVQNIRAAKGRKVSNLPMIFLLRPTATVRQSAGKIRSGGRFLGM